MPEDFLVAKAADGDAVLLNVGDDRDVLVVALLLPDADDRHLVKLSEASAEIHQLVIAEGLTADAQNKVIAPRLADLREQRVVHLGEVDVQEFRSQRSVERADLQRRADHLDISPNEPFVLPG